MQVELRPSGLPWLYRRIPALHSLSMYSLQAARGDLVAGVTVATVAVPQAMAYALVAGLPVEYGLYTAIIMTAVGAVFDSSRELINGPTNAISIAVLSAVVHTTVGEERIHAVVLLALLIGIIQIAIALLRLGDLTQYISHSVIVGFTLGAGTLLPLDQLKNLLGLRRMGDVHDTFVQRFWLTLTEGGPIHQATLWIGLGTMAAVIALRALKRLVGWPLLPDLLLVVFGMAGVVWWWRLDEAGVQIVGAIPTALPSFQPPALDAAKMVDLAPSALAIALLGMLEAIAMAKSIAARTGQRLDVGQQCLSEGLANAVGSMFHCMPGSGSLTRSAINHQAGAVSQWAGVVSAIAVAAIVVIFAPVAAYIPKAALAGILMLASVRMVDWSALRYHLQATRFDRTIVLATALSAIFISIEFCVMIGVFLSFMLAVPRAGRMHLTEFVITDEANWHERLPKDKPHPSIAMFGLEGELFFGSGSSLEAHFDEMEKRLAGIKVLILRVKRARNPDAVGTHALSEFVLRAHARGVQVVLSGVRDELHEVLARCQVLEEIGRANVFPEQQVRQRSTRKAVDHAFMLVGLPLPIGVRDFATATTPVGPSRRNQPE